MNCGLGRIWGLRLFPTFAVPVFALILLGVNALSVLADGFEIKPYKDRIFAYRKPLLTEDDGGYRIIPYDPLKDINERDETPVRKVKSYFVAPMMPGVVKDLAIEANGRKITHWGVGALKGNANFTAIFLHGRDGDRDLGFDDDRFGGNFNRAKNLALRNGGIYISTNFTDFEEKGRQDLAALIAHYRPLTKGPVILACGSMGSFVCWRLISNASSSAMIDGILIMGGFPDPQFLESGKLDPGIKDKPVYLAHGEIDYVYKWQDQKRFYDALKAQGNRVRLVVFKNGKHGTPERMTDWREALNFILAK